MRLAGEHERSLVLVVTSGHGESALFFLFEKKIFLY